MLSANFHSVVSRAHHQGWASGGGLPVIEISRSAGLRSVAAGKNRSASRRSNRFSPPVCHSLRTWLSQSSIPDRPGRPSSSRPPLRGSDAPECKRTCCFSRARPAPSGTQHCSFHVSQRAYPYSFGSGPRGCLAFREPRDKYAIHRPSLILSWRHLGVLLPFGLPIAACRNARSIASAMPTDSNTDRGAARNHVRLFTRRILAYLPK